MKCPPFKSGMRSVLGYVVEGLMWMGVPFGMDAAVAAELSKRRRRSNEDRLFMTPLSPAERLVWAELVDRLR